VVSKIIGPLVSTVISSLVFSLSLKLPARSFILPHSISIKTPQSIDESMIISNVVAIIGVIVLHIASPYTFTSLQSKLQISISSEKVTKNFIVFHDVGLVCPSAKSIESICGLIISFVVSKIHDIGQYNVVLSHNRLLALLISDKKSLLRIFTFVQLYCILSNVEVFVQMVFHIVNIVGMYELLLVGVQFVIRGLDDHHHKP
jgi:hypothetical protein